MSMFSRGTLVTGANGFIGSALCRKLRTIGAPVQGLVRPGSNNLRVISGVGVSSWDCLDDSLPSKDIFCGVDTVVHLAGRAHVLKQQSQKSLDLYRRINTQAAYRLALAAVSAKVRHFIFISSVLVHGRASGTSSLTEESFFNPEDGYALSKLEAEQQLRSLAAQKKIHVTILRVPLVYGPGVGGNFLRLLHYAYKGWPLPLKNVCNQRSLIALENLVDIISCCIRDQRAFDQTFLVSDGENLSTSELLERLAKFLGRPCRLWPCPEKFLRFCGKVLSREADINRLLGSLKVNSSKIKALLSWVPVVTTNQALFSTAQWYKDNIVSGGQP